MPTDSPRTGLNEPVSQFLDRQLAAWPMAKGNFEALKGVKEKTLDVDGLKIRVQFNPARIVSSGAKVDKASLKKRPCFLCEKNRPAEQFGMPFGKDYTVLINPFPIFPQHFTIPLNHHHDQLISGRIGDMAALAKAMPGYTVFYNGPRCGASAPDHMHFQAGNSDFLPLNDNLEALRRIKVLDTPDGTMSYTLAPVCVWIVESPEAEGTARLFERLYCSLPVPEGEVEPMLNLLCSYDELTGLHRLVAIPRKAHRPSFYGTETEEQMLLSPASVDMGGVFITPLEKDFNRLDSDIVRKVFEELCLSPEATETIAKKIGDKAREAPVIKVGIMSRPSLTLSLSGHRGPGGEAVRTGSVTLQAGDNGKVLLDGRAYDSVSFIPATDADNFTAKDVTIGVNFHWQREEDQKFAGSALIINDGEGNLVLINVIDVESYLKSVISSEMSATASLELLKAHAVISRGWLYAQIDRGRSYVAKHIPPVRLPHIDVKDIKTIIKWYDRDDHALFDVCADDHCQRYQGLTRQTTPNAIKAVDDTAFEVMTYDGRICDTRFSKCCGGVFEEFQACWDDTPHPYLVARSDSEHPDKYPDLTREEVAQDWIMSSPDAFCNCTDKDILSQVLNDYDQETTHFYRWEVKYTAEELHSLLLEKSGIDFGLIKSMKALNRGTSGRITALLIEGTLTSVIVGKELEIRRYLSKSHLYSSAFKVIPDETDPATGCPKGFTLHGAGWGHGAGLCQIGAAVMGARGYDYRQILTHYFPGAEIKKLF